MTAVPFPILRLPSSAIQKCLKQMSVAKLITISFISKNTTEIIRMLDKKDIFETIALAPSVSLDLLSNLLNIYDFVLKPDQLLPNVETWRGFELEELTIPEFTVKQFIDHIVHVFFQNEGVALDIQNFQINNLSGIQEYTKNLNIEFLDINSLEAEDVKLLKMFPSLEELSVSDVRISDSVLIQNFRQLKLYHANLAIYYVQTVPNLK